MEQEVLDKLEEIEERLKRIESLIREASNCDMQNFTTLNNNNKMWIEHSTVTLLEAIKAIK